jgi:hypothetical protein
VRAPNAVRRSGSPQMYWPHLNFFKYLLNNFKKSLYRMNVVYTVHQHYLTKRHEFFETPLLPSWFDTDRLHYYSLKIYIFFKTWTKYTSIWVFEPQLNVRWVYRKFRTTQVTTNRPKIVLPELVFTELILQIFYWIYEIAIHSPICILDLPTNIYLWKLYYLFLEGNWFFLVCLTV